MFEILMRLVGNAVELSRQNNRWWKAELNSDIS